MESEYPQSFTASGGNTARIEMLEESPGHAALRITWKFRPADSEIAEFEAWWRTVEPVRSVTGMRTGNVRTEPEKVAERERQAISEWKAGRTV